MIQKKKNYSKNHKRKFQNIISRWCENNISSLSSAEIQAFMEQFKNAIVNEEKIIKGKKALFNYIFAKRKGEYNNEAFELLYHISFADAILDSVASCIGSYILFHNIFDNKKQ